MTERTIDKFIFSLSMFRMMPGTPEGHSSGNGGNNAPMLDRAGRYSLDHSPGFPGSNNPQTPNPNITPSEWYTRTYPTVFPSIGSFRRLVALYSRMLFNF